MKNKILLISFLSLTFVLVGNSYATGQSGAGQDQQGSSGIHEPGAGLENPELKAQNQGTNQGLQNINTVNQAEINTGTQVQQQTQQKLQDESGTGNQVQEKSKQMNQEEDKQQGQMNVKQHQSAVANFTRSLLEVANRQGDIGEQVRTIAQEQNQSASTTVQAMEKVQTRSKFKTFLIGTDYKNLGSLRSEVVQTENRLKQLNKLIENVNNEGDKAELQNQVQTLEQEQIKIENFIKAQEGKISLFGWLARMFNK
ncbi:MAG: hypothetical protein ABIF22_00845 [bacterium]